MRKKLFAVMAAVCTIFSSVTFIASALEPIPMTTRIVRGDVNGDGYFGTADIVTLRRWLLGAPGVQLESPIAADLHEDGVIDSYDLCVMRRELVGLDPQKLVVARVKVEDVKTYSLMANLIDESGIVRDRPFCINLDESIKAQSPEPGDILEVEFSGLTYDTYPEEFCGIYSVTVIKN